MDYSTIAEAIWGTAGSKSD